MPSAARTSGAGYSGTPLARKLGIKAGHHVVSVRRPPGWTIPDLPSGVELVDAEAADASDHAAPGAAAPGAAAPGAAALGGADVVVAFNRERAELEPDVTMIAGHLAPTAAAWIVWPRRAGGHRSDITENLLRELFLPTGLVDVKVAALDDDWSGLRFVWRKDSRPVAR